MEHLAESFARIPGVVAVALGGSRAQGRERPDSDWDFGLYYRGTIDPAHVRALGFAGEVCGPGEWGRFVNGGAWLTIDGVRVDLIYRDLHEVLHWTREARAGRFEVVREVGYVAGMAGYGLVGALALNRLLVGELPRPSFPEELRAAAPPRWRHLARGALRVADDHAHRGDVIGCTANLTLAVLATGQARCAERAEW